MLVLDMGEPVKIVELARDMIRLAGHSVDDIKIVVSGLPPGERLFEELLADADSTVPTPDLRLRIARLESREWNLTELLSCATEPGGASDEDMRVKLSLVVPEYRPST